MSSRISQVNVQGVSWFFSGPGRNRLHFMFPRRNCLWRCRLYSIQAESTDPHRGHRAIFPLLCNWRKQRCTRCQRLPPETWPLQPEIIWPARLHSSSSIWDENREAKRIWKVFFFFCKFRQLCRLDLSVSVVFTSLALQETLVMLILVWTWRIYANGIAYFISLD